MVDQKKIQEVLHIVTTKVDEVLGKFPQIDAPVTTLADKVKVPKAYVALGLLLVPFFLLLAMGSGDFAVDMIGFVYPVYASIKAIEGNDKEEDSTWLTYWLVFAMFKTLEGVANRILNMIPYYFFIKVIIFIIFSLLFLDSNYFLLSVLSVPS